MSARSTFYTSGYGDVLPRMYIVAPNSPKNSKTPIAVWRIPVFASPEPIWSMATRNAYGVLCDWGLLSHGGWELVMRHFGLTPLQGWPAFSKREVCAMAPYTLLRHRRALEADFQGALGRGRVDPRSCCEDDPVPAVFVS
jgi:hypothetical protein